MKKQKHRKQTVASNSTRVSNLENSIEDRIRKRAYELHPERGGPPGQDLDDWLQAEREIKAEMNQASEPEA